MTWSLKVSEPSGETRYFSLPPVPFERSLIIGRSESADLILRDPTVGSEAATLLSRTPPSSQNTSAAPSFWLKVSPTAPVARLGSLAVREFEIPCGVPFFLGETQLSLELEKKRLDLPAQPSQGRPWLTCSPSGRELLWMTKKTAATSLAIYLAGETGTGKEILAQLLHTWSDRKAGPFVPLNCSALSPSLAESELFGHVKGAYTGAVGHRSGALMQAHNGTLFLDEIGDLSLELQVKLLRFLENGEIRPVGADHSSRVNVRIVCATHRPLQQLIEEGKFRRDLFYRLASVTLSIPTLRSRPEDIELIATRWCNDLGKTITPQAIARLQSHAWPGNVRELRHAIERACGMVGPLSALIDTDAFDFLLTSENIHQRPELELGGGTLKLEEMERALILKALKITQGNRAKAAQLLGVARSTLFEMLKRHKIKGPRSGLLVSPVAA